MGISYDCFKVGIKLEKKYIFGKYLYTPISYRNVYLDPTKGNSGDPWDLVAEYLNLDPESLSSVEFIPLT